MTITNHAITGALIGAIFVQPLIALPVAFGSHFVLDMIPHWDMLFTQKSKFLNIVLADVSSATVFGTALLIWHPHHWLIMEFCAVAATLGDLIWFPQFLELRAGKKRTFNRLQHVLEDIQWFQRPIGAAVELVWLPAILFMLVTFIRSR